MRFQNEASVLKFVRRRFSIMFFFKVPRSMETPREKEVARGEAPGEGSGLFEHSAANSSELTPAPHGRKIFQFSSFNFVCVLWNDATKHTHNFKSFRKRLKTNGSFYQSSNKCRTHTWGARATREVSQRLTSLRLPPQTYSIVIKVIDAIPFHWLG